MPACGSAFHAMRLGVPGWYVVKAGTDYAEAGPFELRSEAEALLPVLLPGMWGVAEVRP
jgi:hypothetical protein